jgi:hypothetical protein
MPSDLDPNIRTKALLRLRGVARNLEKGEAALRDARRKRDAIAVLAVRAELDPIIADLDNPDGDHRLTAPTLFMLRKVLQPISQPFVRVGWTEMSMAIDILRDVVGTVEPYSDFR